MRTPQTDTPVITGDGAACVDMLARHAGTLTATGVAEQRAAARGDELRVLIVGAGVAGLTLAQLLRARGLHPVLVERVGHGHAQAGYMLGLMPFVDPVLAALGVEAQYLEHSVGMHRYRLRGSRGNPLRVYSLDGAIGQFGNYRGIERGRLLRVIATGDAPVAFQATVTALQQTERAVRVQLAENATSFDADFDVVIAADGLHSATRDLVLGDDQVHTFDTDWGGWVAWAGTDPESDLYEETWGAGFFLGRYPVPGRTGVFLGGPRTETAKGPAGFAEWVRARLHTPDERCARVLTAVTTDPSPHYWSMADVRCTTWATGRVALLGDAAAGFLPTAGVGAAMAMESAFVLADQLAQATPSSVPDSLRSYERTQRPRVEAAQDNSRQLARLMFRRSVVLTRARDLLTPLITVNTALRPIRALLRSHHGTQPSNDPAVK